MEGGGGNVRYGGFWRRVLAYVLDTIVMTAITFAVGAAVGLACAVAGADTKASETVSGVLGFLIGLLYFPIGESSGWQGTPGKRICRMRVVGLDGLRIGFWQAFGRNMAKIVSALPLGIGFLMIGWTERKQGLHDKMAGCLVERGV